MWGSVVKAECEEGDTLRPFVGLNCVLLRMTATRGERLGDQKETQSGTRYAMQMVEGLRVVERARRAVPLLRTSARNGRWSQ
jgi:hypothetical protein